MQAISENIFCSLCGVVIEAHDGTLVDEHDRLLWNFEVRAIRTTRFVLKPFVTGRGFLNFGREVIADLRADVCHNQPNANLEAHDAGYVRSRRYWSYPVHDACWELLRYRVDPKRSVGSNRIARHLFALLYNTRTNGLGLLSPRHNYGGAVKFLDNWSRAYDSDSFYLNHDPNDAFDFEVDAYTAANLDQSLSTMKISDSEDGYAGDVFYTLPNEIINMVLERLRSKDVYHLRLASRAVVVMSREPQLPPSFWLSRFEADAEMGFVFANRDDSLPSDPLDWRRIYGQAKSMLRNSRTYPGFQNRHRIWMTLDQLLPALRLRLANEAQLAKNPHPNEEPSIQGSVCRSKEASAEVTLGTANPGTRTSTELEAGCRLFEKHCLNWSLAEGSEVVRLGVSLVRHDGRTYLSGLRLLPTGDASGSIEFTRAGLINPENEQYFDLNPNDTLNGVRVNVAIDGIIGLHLDLEGSSGPYTCSIESPDAIDSESGIAEFPCQMELHRAGFVMGLDAFKMASLQLFESGQVSDESEPQQPMPAEIWQPNLPSRESLSLSTSGDWHGHPAVPPQSFDLHLDMDFGGRDGDLLRSLTRVDVLMGSFPCIFLGFSFVYSDGSERHYGRQSYEPRASKRIPCIVQSFPVAGDKGEIISKVTTSYDLTEDIVREITLYTNFDRSATFSLQGRPFHDGNLVAKTLAPSGPDGNRVITAFCAKLKSLGGQFRDLIIRTVTPSSRPETTKPLRMDTPHLLTPRILSSSAAGEMLAYSGGFAFTAANLRGVRTIHFSAGQRSHSRGRDHISGLMLEYVDSGYPCILGQWINKFATLEINTPDERVTEVTSWHDFTNRFSRVKFGPTVGIRISTSSSRTKDFILQDRLEGKVCLRHRENPYESLSSITWGCNYQWDQVSVECEPRATKRDKVLVYGHTSRSTPNWAVKENIFMDEEGPDGNPDSVSLIEVTYKFLSSEISGISFRYGSGKVRTLGSRGERPREQELEQNESLVRLDLGFLRGQQVGSITFYTDKDRELTFTHESDRTSSFSRIRKTETHILDRNYNGPGEERVKFDVPESAEKFVGLWGISKRQDGTLKFPMFGPIFEGSATNEVESEGLPDK